MQKRYFYNTKDGLNGEIVVQVKQKTRNKNHVGWKARIWDSRTDRKMEISHLNILTAEDALNVALRRAFRHLGINPMEMI